MMPMVASFYTPNWEYPASAVRLRQECEGLGLDHYIQERPDAGGYLENCRQKPVYLLEVMRRHDRPLLWIDVDGSILRQPMELEVMHVDFGACPMRKSGRQWHVGTLYFNNTPGALALLERWVAELDSRTSDEAALDRVWRSPGWPATTAELPATYFAVRRSNGRIMSLRPKNRIVIMHRLSTSPAKAAAKAALR